MPATPQPRSGDATASAERGEEELAASPAAGSGYVIGDRWPPTHERTAQPPEAPRFGLAALNHALNSHGSYLGVVGSAGAPSGTGGSATFGFFPLFRCNAASSRSKSTAFGCLPDDMVSPGAWTSPDLSAGFRRSALWWRRNELRVRKASEAAEIAQETASWFIPVISARPG
jgi:hypothetical protein